jgi:hypothetical protein
MKPSDEQLAVFYPKMRDLANRANALKMALGDAGMWRTMHKMDEVTKQLIWEAADLINGKQALPDLATEEAEHG